MHDSEESDTTVLLRDLCESAAQEDPHLVRHRLRAQGAAEPQWEGEIAEMEDGWSSGLRLQSGEGEDK